MSELLKLPAAELREIYTGLAQRQKRAANVLEKDVWVVWTLGALFEMPGRLPMAFKGGTSLSKVFKAIERFSEDIDVTLDYHSFPTKYGLMEPLKGNRRADRDQSIRVLAAKHVRDIVRPYLQERLTAEFGLDPARVTLEDDGQSLRLPYPSALTPADAYIAESVKIEFGGRNPAEPTQVATIEADIAADLAPSGLDLPTATVDVLAAERTFWEKATLIHAECRHPEFGRTRPVSRKSRHWYDLHALADHEAGARALNRPDLLRSVVEHKNVYYPSGSAHYEECLTGRLRLVPDEPGLAGLERDYHEMERSGMFYGSPPTFREIVTRLRELEAVINHGQPRQ